MLPKHKWAWAFLASKHYPSHTNQMVIDLLKQQGSWCTLALGHLRCLDGRYSIRYLAIQRDDSDKEVNQTNIPKFCKECISALQELCRKAKVISAPNTEVLWCNSKLYFKRSPWKTDTVQDAIWQSARCSAKLHLGCNLHKTKTNWKTKLNAYLNTKHLKCSEWKLVKRRKSYSVLCKIMLQMTFADRNLESLVAWKKFSRSFGRVYVREKKVKMHIWPPVIGTESRCKKRKLRKLLFRDQIPNSTQIGLGTIRLSMVPYSYFNCFFP